ncbi:MAG: DUF3306 domain-containing protein [Sedimenticolaceae bacterium]
MSKDPQEPLAEDQQPRPNETFLERFHRRKTAARQATEAPQTAPADTTEAALVPQQSEPEAVPDLTDADMPPVESLTADSDYRGFLSPKVSESLRRTALRRLFHGSEFNVIDELDDYAEDFTTFEALGDFVTADMRHQIEVAARKQAAAVKQALLDEEEPVEAVEDQRVVDDAMSSEDVAATSQEMPVSASEPSDDSEQRRPRS